MTVLSFIASMTGSLAWPVAAFCIAFLFKSQIRALIERLNEVGFGDAKATFARKLDAAERNAESLPPPIDVPDNADALVQERLGEATVGNAITDDALVDSDSAIALAYQKMILKRYSELGVESGRFATLLDISPSAAVLDTYSVVERALYRVAQRKGLDGEFKRTIPTLLAAKLHRLGLIPNDIVPLIDQLREMRNRAAHGAEISVTDAVRFREVATRVAAVLRNAARDT